MSSSNTLIYLTIPLRKYRVVGTSEFRSVYSILLEGFKRAAQHSFPSGNVAFSGLIMRHVKTGMSFPLRDSIVLANTAPTFSGEEASHPSTQGTLLQLLLSAPSLTPHPTHAQNSPQPLFYVPPQFPWPRRSCDRRTFGPRTRANGVLLDSRDVRVAGSAERS
ncbi:hypothetical protein K443DRAFT_6200 [Laccaria amethystina LaAM-08-1]|uniref:Uncharacterized protein n=1 Tax=Laccaria amethystina LaAM-08-1 TaxID=1095629 RepID=A0A0C9XC48_9AGAR|nr:hypothetical protein K443DRAFT_6200 [Laccaria amethystina LaAM-08-1]